MAKKEPARKTMAGRGRKDGGGQASEPLGKPAVRDGGAASPKAPQGATPKSAKTSLTKPQLREFRDMLLAKRRELVGDMSGIEAEALGADRQESKGDISDHPADAGTDNFEQEFSLGLLESEGVLLAEIDESLRRIDEGTYGICLGTGRPISTARLEARPWSKYSIEYARMVEKGIVRPGERVVSADAEGDYDEEGAEVEEDEERDETEEHEDLEGHDEIGEHEGPEEE